jgi:hypothetical protein
MTPDFSPFSYVFNNPVNFIDEFGLMGSGWNTRGREETDAEKANKEQMDNPRVQKVEITQNPGSMANVPDYGSKGWYKEGEKVMDALPAPTGFWDSMRQEYGYKREFKSAWGFEYSVNANGTIHGYKTKEIIGTPPDFGIGRAGTIYKGIKEGLPYIGKSFILNRINNITYFCIFAYAKTENNINKCF